MVQLNMGGPSNLEEVGSFLHNLFMDRDIIQLPFQKYKFIDCIKIVLISLFLLKSFYLAY